MSHPHKTDEIMGTERAIASPDWAPDNCPPATVGLIADEQYLEDLKLRGLSSANSAEFHQAVRNLQRQLGEAFQKGTASRGWRRRHWTLEFALGCAIGAVAAVFALSVLAGLLA